MKKLICLLMALCLLGLAACSGTETDPKRETNAPRTTEELSGTEAPQTEAPKTEAPQTDAPQTEAQQTDAPQTEAPQTETEPAESTEPVLPKADITHGVVKGNTYVNYSLHLTYTLPKTPEGLEFRPDEKLAQGFVKTVPIRDDELCAALRELKIEWTDMMAYIPPSILEGPRTYVSYTHMSYKDQPGGYTDLDSYISWEKIGRDLTVAMTARELGAEGEETVETYRLDGRKLTCVTTQYTKDGELIWLHRSLYLICGEYMVNIDAQGASEKEVDGLLAYYKWFE